MENEKIKLQMRKSGYDMACRAKFLNPNINCADGVAFADRQFAFLTWLQSLYDCNCLKGDFHTDNIVKELWDRVRRFPDPLQKLEDGSIELNKTFQMVISGDDRTKGMYYGKQKRKE